MRDITISNNIDNIDNTDKEKLAKKYSKTNQVLSLIDSIIFFIILIILITTGLSKKIESIAYSFTSNDYLALLIYLTIIGIFQALLTFPLNFYSEYILEHKYKLSNQNIFSFFTEKFKEILVGIIIGVPLILIFFFVLKEFKTEWWFITGIFMFFFSIIIGRLAPTLIMPIFYKYKPLDNESLKEKVFHLAKKTNIKVEDVFTFDMSKNTKKANAAFTGLGKSKRIILGDTLINNFTEEEIEIVLAHEIGHYKKNHIIKLIIASTISTFLGLFIVAKLYANSIKYFNFSAIDEIAALPLLVLFLSLYSLITTPIINILSRKFEWEADTFALDIMRNKNVFISAMEKLADQNLADKKPNKVIEFLFHSHPSLSKRIEFARKYNFT